MNEIYFSSLFKLIRSVIESILMNKNLLSIYNPSLTIKVCIFALSANYSLCAFSAGKSTPIKATNIKLSNSDQIAIYNLLIKNSQIIFDPQKNKHIGCPKGNLGNYVSTLIVNGTQGDKKDLGITCENSHDNNKYFPAPSAKFESMDCKLSAYSSDKEGESPWNYELIFRVSKNLESLDKNLFHCPGV